MDILKLLVEFLDVVIWPLTVIIIVLAFKKEIVQSFKRIKSVKYKDLEASFEEGLKAVESQTKLIKEESIGKVTTTKSEKARFFDRLHSLAEDSPRGAILEAWVELENTIKSYAETHGFDGENISPYRLIQEIQSKADLPREIIESLHKVRNLRNEAVHASEFSLSIDEAERYIDSIEILDVYFSLNQS